jgi:hypothetical protein
MDYEWFELQIETPHIYEVFGRHQPSLLWLTAKYLILNT